MLDNLDKMRNSIRETQDFYLLEPIVNGDLTHVFLITRLTAFLTEFSVT